METRTDFSTFIEQVAAEGGYPTDDVLRVILPLFEKVHAVHETGKVAPLEGTSHLFVDEAGCLGFDEERVTAPKVDWLGTVGEKLATVVRGDGVEVVGERRQVVDLSDEHVRVHQEELAQSEAKTRLPRFVPGYQCWEHQAGQHDPLTDIFSLGLVLASVACGLDLSHEEDFERFVQHRSYLQAINSRLNPVVASVIVQMTELQRAKRAQDLPSMAARLRNYREQPTEYDFDLNRLKGFREANLTGKRRLIQTHLRDRLFEISRRNSLLYFRPTQHHVNLTLASVPAVLDFRNIRHEQLFVWHEQLADLIGKQSTIPLNRFVRFEDAPYVPELLDKIISEAKRDRTEFGFAQLKLVICFLRWNNLKEAPQERIVSPLLLVPVELQKKKGVRDSFTLRATSHLAEVNPVLRHHLRQLYNLDLPEAVDLTEMKLETFHEYLVQQIQASESAVTLKRSDRPQIEIIHQKARQRLDQYRRRQKLSARSPSGYAKLQHSYKRENMKPLGLQMFLQKIKPASSPFDGVLGDASPRALPQFIIANEPDPASAKPKVLEKERLTYSLKGPEDENPYTWVFDLCNLTLGNFNYRKMSLVTDYNRLVELDLPNPAFDRIFSLEPRAVSAPLAELPLGELFTVVSCDPTQAGAIGQARVGESFIIQGPPGTGKSQTITNLVADYIARGKRVLFVCEKRAAIDVVYHRLSQQGLDEWCCLIHDSQTDKKAFIQDLAGTYEKLLRDVVRVDEAEGERAATVKEIERHLAVLDRFEQALAQVPETVGLSVRALLRRLVELRGNLPELSDVQEETLGAYREWKEFGDLLVKLSEELVALGEDSKWHTHAIRLINPKIFHSDRPLESVRRLLASALPRLARIEAVAASQPDLAAFIDTPDKFGRFVLICREMEPLAERHLLDLLDPRSKTSAEWVQAQKEIRAKKTAWEKAKQAAEAWRVKLPPQDCALALAEAESLDRKTLRWLSPGHWKLRKVMLAQYDFARHPIRRTWAQALRELEAEYVTQAAWEASCVDAESKFGQQPEAFAAYLERVRSVAESASPEVKKFLAHLRKSDDGGHALLELLPMADEFDALSVELAELMVGYEKLPWPELRKIIESVEAELPLLKELASLLAELTEIPEGLASAARMLPLTMEELEAGLAKKSLHALYREDRHLSRFDSRLLREKIASLQGLYNKLLSDNGRVIAARQQQRFIEHVTLSGLPVSQLTPDQRMLKKNYSAGRRELEHEFGKTMRFRSIRDLAAGNPGKVLADLKPVWLMSPLSVSDTLPLEAGHFDVVIFDEASQIPVEDAVPALYRAHQVIVVGDEMQLPPTKFFAAGGGDGETLVVEEEEEKIELSMEADSFLTQSAINLPSTMLGWHYRSRSEALIGFSNAAFYRGGLLTIPDRALPDPGQKEIAVNNGDRGDDFVDVLLARSLSFHFHPEGVYEDRRNRSEAEYIAQLVRGILLRKTGKSIGIVAFSEAQQTEIENALRRLADSDASFAELYEPELDREEEGQFCGLFIKNLENVQGDERDIILLSVCYGYNRDRRMIMNFGPINQRGGEKRLNVIFSRAKEHMAIVSSIKYSDVKNEYNDGANSLRLFLQYAEAFSRGDWEHARRILTNLNPEAKKTLTRAAAPDAVAEQIADGLRLRGWQVDAGVGQSRFRCDLAARDPNTPAYALAIFIDQEERIRSSGLAERAIFQPRVLKSFGWNFAHVLTKDWFHDPQGVLDRIERQMENGEPEEAPVVAEVPAPRAELKASPIEESLPTEEVPAPVILEPVAALINPEAAPEIAKSEQSPVPVDAPEFDPNATSDGRPYYFELREGPSKKFWEITRQGLTFTTRHGRIGTTGQSQTKTWPNDAACRREAGKVIREKMRKGYRLVLAS